MTNNFFPLKHEFRRELCRLLFIHDSDLERVVPHVPKFLDSLTDQGPIPITPQGFDWGVVEARPELNSSTFEAEIFEICIRLVV